ncbi:GNAT family N-acetyltransferase [Micromonospora sp. CPCC 206061]|uniref:GNAT family N-acetyltransferase n=1 Tax=Micromonospora sp. CPCC 206061 TaxID=3122410 RepID=UPI002FF216D0
MVELSVRPMTQAEYDEWIERLARSFAESQVAAGNWATDDAITLARQGNAVLLPNGLATEGMLLLKGVLPDGTAVGVAWIGLNHPRGNPGCAFLYDIEVDEEHRGAGYGRALLAAVEEAARSHGSKALELNVFGGNAPAIHLYETSGYALVTQQMRKELR